MRLTRRRACPTMQSTPSCQRRLVCMPQAGAAHVYGIECSTIAEQAQQIVMDNGFSDTVTIIYGKVEEVELPVPKVRPAACKSCWLPPCGVMGGMRWAHEPGNVGGCGTRSARASAQLLWPTAMQSAECYNIYPQHELPAGSHQAEGYSSSSAGDIAAAPPPPG